MWKATTYGQSAWYAPLCVMVDEMGGVVVMMLDGRSEAVVR